MEFCKKALTWVEVLAVMVVLSLILVPFSEATWSVDLTSLSADVITVGTAVLAIAAVIFGFRVVRRMIGH